MLTGTLRRSCDGERRLKCGCWGCASDEAEVVGEEEVALATGGSPRTRLSPGKWEDVSDLVGVRLCSLLSAAGLLHLVQHPLEGFVYRGLGLGIPHKQFELRSAVWPKRSKA